jgi:hypothetical protein
MPIITVFRPTRQLKKEDIIQKLHGLEVLGGRISATESRYTPDEVFIKFPELKDRYAFFKESTQTFEFYGDDDFINEIKNMIKNTLDVDFQPLDFGETKKSTKELNIKLISGRHYQIKTKGHRIIFPKHYMFEWKPRYELRQVLERYILDHDKKVAVNAPANSKILMTTKVRPHYRKGRLIRGYVSRRRKKVREREVFI